MDILRTEIRNKYTGYMLQRYYKLVGEPLIWGDLRVLIRIPDKITAFIRRGII